MPCFSAEAFAASTRFERIEIFGLTAFFSGETEGRPGFFVDLAGMAFGGYGVRNTQSRHTEQQFNWEFNGDGNIFLSIPILLGISNPVMPKQANAPVSPKRGRPATGKVKIKLSASAPQTLIAAAMKMAAKRGESFSSYVARAIQNQLLNEQ